MKSCFDRQLAEARPLISKEEVIKRAKIQGIEPDFSLAGKKVLFYMLKSGKKFELIITYDSELDDFNKDQRLKFYDWSDNASIPIFELS
jgi:hypothetical protein